MSGKPVPICLKCGQVFKTQAVLEIHTSQKHSNEAESSKSGTDHEHLVYTRPIVQSAQAKEAQRALGFSVFPPCTPVAPETPLFSSLFLISPRSHRPPPLSAVLKATRNPIFPKNARIQNLGRRRVAPPSGS